MPQLLFISCTNSVRLLFKSSDWLFKRSIFSTKPIPLLLLCCFKFCFTCVSYMYSSRWLFTCAHATQVFVTPTAATVWEQCLLSSACVEVWLLFESGVWFVQHVWRCGYWEQLLNESGVWLSRYGMLQYRGGWSRYWLIYQRHIPDDVSRYSCART